MWVAFTFFNKLCSIISWEGDVVLISSYNIHVYINTISSTAYRINIFYKYIHLSDIYSSEGCAKIKEALVPPKPNELEMTARSFFSTEILGA